jgi:hypothetical protein
MLNTARSAGGSVEVWEILMTDEVEQFLDTLYESDRETHKLVNQAILVLERNGPAEGRPLVDTIVGSSIPTMKELRPGSVGRSEIRILFAFDPWRSAILLIAGDKAGQCNAGTEKRSREQSNCTSHTYKSVGRSRGDERIPPLARHGSS